VRQCGSAAAPQDPVTLPLLGGRGPQLLLGGRADRADRADPVARRAGEVRLQTPPCCSAACSTARGRTAGSRLKTPYPLGSNPAACGGLQPYSVTTAGA